MSKSSGSDFRAEVREERVSLWGHGLGVGFDKSGDRWTDLILGQEPGIALAKSSSVRPENEDARRIVSPVYQEVHLHGTDAGPILCLLLTGRSFNHHFSAAVTLTRDASHPGGVLLDFDVADRCRSPVESLAATYLVGLDSGALVAADPVRIVWDVANTAPGRLELMAVPPASLSLAEAGRHAMRVQVLASLEPLTFTHRFRYGWRWTSSGEHTR
jgi:hypothetical protein